MARVEITLNNRVYPIACEDGQEGRVREVAAFVGERVREIQGSVRTATDTHLLVMVCLMLGDELLDLREGKIPGAPAPAPSPLEDPELAARLQKLADRIEAIAARVETP